MFFFFLPVYLEMQGASPVLIGTILSSVGIVMALVHIPSGYLADRIGRRPLLWAAWIMATFATLVMAFSLSLFWFSLGMILYGATAFVSGPISSYITAARGTFTVTRALSIYSAAFNVGAIVGPILGGWVSATLGMRQSLIIAACIFIVSTFLVFMIRSQPIESTAHRSIFQIRSEVLNMRFIQFIILAFFTMFVMYLPVPLSQNYLSSLQMNLKEIGILLSLRGLGVVFLNLFFGQFNYIYGFIFAHFGMLAFSFLLLNGQDMKMFAPAYFLLGSFQTARVMINAQVRNLVNVQNMGVAYGFVETAIAIAVILAPLLAGAIYTINPLWVYWISVLAITIILVINLGYYFLTKRQFVRKY